MRPNAAAASTDAYGACGESGDDLSPLPGDTGSLPLPHLFGLLTMALLGLGCLHALLYHLHAILVPFVLGAFIVLTLQPTVEIVYRFLAGLAPPHRWGGCCCLRRTASTKRWNSWSRAVAEDSGSDEDEVISLLPLSPREDLTVGHVFDGVARFLAVSFVFIGMLLLIVLLVLGLAHGAMQVKENWAAYRKGIDRLEGLRDHAVRTIMDELHMTKSMRARLNADATLTDSIFNRAHDWIWLIVDNSVSGLSGGLSSAAIMLLYVLFWLLQPLPTGGRAGRLVRKYLYKKTFASFLYGLCVTILFLALGIDMAVLFGVVSFFLNFVPEIGSFISMLIPVPVILLDGRLENPFLVLVLAFVGQLVFKFIFANILEVKLIEHDQQLGIHPVWVILGLSYFGYIWGPIGMLMSVPILAMAKTAAMGMRDPSVFGSGPAAGKAETEKLATGFIACLEGRRNPGRRRDDINRRHSIA